MTLVTKSHEPLSRGVACRGWGGSGSRGPGASGFWVEDGFGVSAFRASGNSVVGLSVHGVRVQSFRDSGCKVWGLTGEGPGGIDMQVGVSCR